ERWQALAVRVVGLAKRNGMAEAVTHLQQFVAEQLTTLPSESDVMRVSAEHIFAERGQRPVGDANLRGFRSQSQFERRFKQVVGITAKSYARLVRLQSCCGALAETPSRSLTELAHAYDYTDQSHFIRDFKALAGRIPSAMAAMARAFLQRA